MSLKKAVGFLHLWLGLISGIIVFIIAITGCMYAFQAEIQDATQPYRFVAAENRNFLPPSKIRGIADAALPGRHLHAVLYESKTDAVQAIYYQFEEYYNVVYINPYSGKVLEVKDMEAGFFPFILDGHFYLWLPHEIGQPIVAGATLVFFAMMISGIVLWWPKNKAAARQRFSIKWDARWRRKNYDLHNVLGFYASWLGIIFAVTGLVWGYQWFSSAWYATTTGGKEFVPYYDPGSDTTAQASLAVPAIDQIWLRMLKEHPDAESIEVHIPDTKSASVNANINPDASTYWQIDYRYFDQYTLKELPVKHVWNRFDKAGLGDKIMRANYDIHVGAILGLPGKILAFFASLIIASLPITGFYIWWGRRNKEKKVMHSLVKNPVRAKPVLARS
ncbi:PepSY-associated TM helix domain-containing protein [Dyadobacter sandarakinus]|uniref:PepSY domain-containing protein n=1 Tax=Dyadobacter sandarakinus TaxID=2747268 RepID=A0ABX7I716_9BACT|nr:PepSY-associated TM helix domain-containing protein [Dyadobacter sandarakinus]QRR01272.1 PepSY domain-containing protein [Dyadobacter sandarakinus]